MNSTFVTAALLIILSLPPQVSFAGDLVELTRNSNVRSSKNFYGRSNVLSLIPNGATVEIISKSKLPSGANALEIKIIKPEDKIALNDKAPLYIWQSGANIPKPKTDTEAGTTCTEGTCLPQNPTSLAVQDIQNVTQAIEEQESIAQPVSDLDAAIKKYSESPEVAKTIAWAKLHKKRGDGKCYRHTKEALATQTRGGRGPGNNLIPKWYGGRDANEGKEGISNLKQKGFINLLEQPEYKDMSSRSAPHGAVLVYKHINSRGADDNKPGHTEIKFDEVINGKSTPQFFYGPIRDYPVNNKPGSRYVLTGIMIKSPMGDK